MGRSNDDRLALPDDERAGRAPREADQMALEILLNREISEEQRWTALRQLASEAVKVLKGEIDCPECSDHGPHADNGTLGWDRRFSCRACNCHFDLRDVVVEAEVMS
ncbi:MAG TPA: hypothetical protein VJ891_10065 [Casimicrobiaceae bacterium]|nr:hypothetical protein [Casimicrobiaceae bacterium]